MKKLLEVVDFTDLGEVQSDLICIEDNKENREILLDFYSLDIEEEEKENFMKGNINEIRDCSRAIRLKIYEEEIERIKRKYKAIYEDEKDISTLKFYT